VGPMAIAATVVGAGGLGAVGTAAYGAFHPRSSLFGRVVWRAGPDARGVALTFDDGPTPGVTDPILDALGEAGAHATFFVLGDHVRAHPDLVRRASDEGHLVGNHTMHHHRYGLLRRDRYWLDEVAGAQAAIEDVIRKKPRLFRPPMGFTSMHIARAARANDCAMVTWSRRGLDGPRRDPGRVAARVLHALGPGEIVALHDGIDGARRVPSRTSLRAIPAILAGLESEGLHPVRLDELLRIDPYASS
jgi:peptidoglycan-N-acetylglucosamine deacetylase